MRRLGCRNFYHAATPEELIFCLQQYAQIRTEVPENSSHKQYPSPAGPRRRISHSSSDNGHFHNMHYRVGNSLQQQENQQQRIPPPGDAREYWSPLMLRKSQNNNNMQRQYSGVRKEQQRPDVLIMAINGPISDKRKKTVDEKQQRGKYCLLELRIADKRIDDQKYEVDKMKQAIMKEKEERDESFDTLFARDRLSIDPQVFSIKTLEQYDMQEIEQTDNHALEPVAPHEYPDIPLKHQRYPDRHKIGQDERPHRRVRVAVGSCPDAGYRIGIE
jgi:hypothetical protein